MFQNLVNELAKKNITNRALAAAIGCTEKTLYNKMTGNTEFTLKEIRTISDDFLPEFRFEYLFKQKVS